MTEAGELSQSDSLVLGLMNRIGIEVVGFMIDSGESKARGPVLRHAAG